jgi:single-stranded DNA-binding protein
MLNQSIIVGRIEEIQTPAKNILQITIAVTRNYKDEGSEEYGTDYIVVYADKSLSKSAKPYMKVGQIIAVKARLVQPKIAVAPSVVVEKISFISNEKKKEEEK